MELDFYLYKKLLIPIYITLRKENIDLFYILTYSSSAGAAGRSRLGAPGGRSSSLVGSRVK